MYDIKKLQDMANHYIESVQMAKTEPFTRGDILIVDSFIGQKTTRIAYVIFGGYLTVADRRELVQKCTTPSGYLLTVDTDCYIFACGTIPGDIQWENSTTEAYCEHFSSTLRDWGTYTAESLFYRKLTDTEVEAMPDIISTPLLKISKYIRDTPPFIQGALVNIHREGSIEPAIFDQYKFLGMGRTVSRFKTAYALSPVWVAPCRVFTIDDNGSLITMYTSSEYVTAYDPNEHTKTK